MRPEDKASVIVLIIVMLFMIIACGSVLRQTVDINREHEAADARAEQLISRVRGD